MTTVQLEPVSREERRQRAVEALGLGEDVRDERLDRITRVARTALGAQMSTITVLDGDRACYPGAAGYDGTSIARDQTFCDRATRDDALLLVPDAREDPRFAGLDLVRDGTIRSYAGVPLRDRHANVVGVLCVFDPEPATFGTAQQQALRDLAVWAEQELVESAEMTAAARVQASLLPAGPLALDGWDVAGVCLPALAVGGDFFDYGVSDGVLHLGLGDVMGKGTGAALVGAGVRAALRATHLSVVGGADLGLSVTRVARGLATDLDRAGAFAALVEGVVDLSDGRVRYVDAGLGLLLVVRADGSCEPLSGDGRPFGVLPDDRWSEHTAHLAPGDRLVVLSDGLLDLVEDPLHWWRAVGDLLAEHPRTTDLLSAVRRLAARGTALDDVTVLVVHRHAEVGR